MVFCNSHLKNVLDTNEAAAQVFQGMMTRQLRFLFLLMKTAVLSKFSLYTLSILQDSNSCLEW